MSATGWVLKAMEPGTARGLLVHGHIVLGYALIASLVMRLAWGLWGPPHARMGALWHPTAWLYALTGKVRTRQSGYGHDPMASLAYLVLYGMLAVAALSGLALAGIRYDLGPFAGILFDDLQWLGAGRLVHDLVLFGATAFVGLHLFGMVKHERQTGLPVAQSMISGYQYRYKGKEGDS